MTVADAIQLAQSAIEASSGSSEAWHLLAYAHERGKDLESALLAASKAVELSPAEPALWFHRGWLHLKVDAAEDCLNDMEQTIAKGASFGDTYYQETAQLLAAESLRRLGRYKVALAMCQDVRDDFALYVGKALSKRELVQYCCKGEGREMRTEPHQRTRALLKTIRFLEELTRPCDTPRVPAHIRDTARRLLQHYPGVQDIEVAHKALPEVFGPVVQRQAEGMPAPGKRGKRGD